MREIFNRQFYYFLTGTIVTGLFPIILYPFSDYFGMEDDYAELSHGPLHQFPGGDYFESAPQGVDWLIDYTTNWPVFLLFIVQIIVSLIYLLSREYKNGVVYLALAFLSFCLLALQVNVLYWLFD